MSNATTPKAPLIVCASRDTSRPCAMAQGKQITNFKHDTKWLTEEDHPEDAEALAEAPEDYPRTAYHAAESDSNPMQCLTPLTLVRNKIREIVPCGKCNNCLSAKRTDWTFRLTQEMKQADSADFLTVTYSELTVPRNEETGLPEVRKRDVQLFMKRLRQENLQHSSTPLRFYMVAEYGTKTQRPHYHYILFNLHVITQSRLDLIWGLGKIDVGTVTTASIHYTTKYVINRHDDSSGREKPFSLMSRRPGIGHNYVNTHGQWHKSELKNYTQVNGYINRLPHYYKNKIFTKNEKMLLAKQGVALGDENYHKEIERLSQLHHDPANHYDERVNYAHDQVKSKANKSNTF